MKRLLLLVFCFGMSCLMRASDYLMVIDFADGSEVTIRLSKHPVLTFVEQKLCVSAEDEKSEFELADVVNFHFAEDPAALPALHEEDDFHMVWQSDDLIVISHVSADARVLLYGMDGTSYKSHVSARDSRFEVSLSDLPKGIYLLNINSNRTLKITRK